MLRLYFFVLLIFFFSVGYSQTPYGNDWINTNQSYYKIKVAENGIYRIKQSDLVALNIPISTVNAKNFQVFRNGLEVPIFVNGEQDNVLDNNDYIEFYGEKNDGTLDKSLYPIPTDQPHNYYSLFTDTSAYFLTWTSNSPGKRIQNFTAPSTGLSPLNYVTAESLGVYPEAYYQGRFIVAAMSLSDYIEGEGFFGATYGKGSQQIRTLNIPKLYNGTGAPKSYLQTYVAGRSNAQSTSPSGNHHLRIAINNGSTTVTKKDTLFFSYAVAKTGFEIAPTEFGSNLQIIYSAPDDLGAATDFQAVAFAKVTYPRLMDIQGETNLLFKTPGNSSGANTFLQFTNNTLSNPIIWDLNTQTRVVGTTGNTSSFVLSGDQKERSAYLYDGTTFKSAPLNKVELLNINPSSFNSDFLIITHKSLLSGAQNYASYRTQTGYKPLIVTTDQLYDQFYYGVHHPLAIKNFVSYLINKATNKPQYLLLLGKGFENHLIRSAEGLNADLVPTYGSPPSDDLLTARIIGNGLEAAIPTGRVSAKTNEEIEIYLQKLKNYEQYPDSLWRKRFIHISGGNSLGENLSWASYQTNFYNMAKGEFFGADSVNFHKNINQPVSANIKQNIIKEINKGAALLSFLGHGSHQATEIDFGIPNELNNKGKLLTYLVNGCTTGNSYITAPSLGEKHILFPEKGAIGWIGTSSEGIASYLAGFSSILYKNAFNVQYGKSIATAIRESKKQYQNLNDLYNVMHTTQYTFQGDPAMKFYSPAKPDYQTTNQDLYIYPNNVTATADSFAVAIIVKNIGKALNQPLKVSITRTLPNNTTINYPVKTFTRPIYNNDTLYYYIKPNDIKNAGINKFNIKLDPDNQYDELSEANNEATLEYNLVANGVNIIYPKKYAIVPKTDVELVAQSSNLLIATTSYIFEIDTINTFDSPWKKNSGVLSAGFMPKWKPTLLSSNNQVYYWRVKLNIDEDKGGIWQESSFTYINNSNEGWNQSHQQQLVHTSLNNIEYNTSTKLFEFAKSSFYTVIQTRGDDASTVDERTYRSNPGGRLGYIGYEFEGLTLLALKPNTFKEFSYPSSYNIINNEGDGTADYYSGQFYFNINNAVAVDSLIEYLKQIPTGFYVIGFNGRNINLSALPQAAKDAFKLIGVANIGNIGIGEPYAFWGEKGIIPGTALEKTADYTSNVPPRNQQIRFEKTYPFPFDQGSYISDKAGATKNWKKAYYNLKNENSDEVSFDLIGYNQNGNQQILQTNLPTDSLDITHIDAKTYPKLAIKANIKDIVNRTPPQILKFKFLYDELPETTINPEIKNEFYKGTVQEGDSIKWEIAYQNISKYESDSVNVQYTLTKPDRNLTTEKIGKIATLQPHAVANLKFKIPTLGLVGNNLLKVDFIPINGNDTYSFNNYIQQSFAVTRDQKPPIVDIAFDGKHIINGEIVSPLPNISINLSDENNFILLSDTAMLEVYLKHPDNGEKRIAYSSGKMTFIPATSANNNKASVLYRPEKLADGIYTLTVKSKDATGNNNKTSDYNINFEVINESSITHFYPYPNPFTTAMKFVFTLTGNKIPDKIKVQIMTVTGKIVREVFKEELGNIRIGNNISDFTWDGTDQYGDRLANGVYFYNVIVQNNDNTEIKHRNTKTDKFFKQNTGKIYLMR